MRRSSKIVVQVEIVISVVRFVPVICSLGMLFNLIKFGLCNLQNNFFLDQIGYVTFPEALKNNKSLTTFGD